MNKNYIENSLKRFLKRKVKITLGFVVAFMITGVCAFAEESTAEKGSVQWHKEQAEKWLEGYGTKEFPDISGDKISITQDGKINFEGKEIDLSSIKGNLSNKEKDILTAMGNIINGKDVTTDMSDIEGYNEGFNAEISNKGILEKAQSIPENKVGYNYGIISAQDGGQTISGQGYNYGIINTNKWAQKISSGTGYNYGIINTTSGEGQITWSSNVNLYNYGIINANSYSQYISGAESNGFNYGVLNSGKSASAQESLKGAILNNYGIINGVSFGQRVKSESGTINNYGLINTNDIGQEVNGTGKSCNYGIISTVNGVAINNNGLKAENYGVIKNATGKVFKGKVDNYGMVILTDVNNSTIQTDGLGTGENKGIVLTKDYALLEQEINGEKVNAHVTDLTVSGTVDGAENKTYYAKDKTVNISANKLEGNVLTSVITQDNGTAFKYTGTDELVLKDTTVMGYFEGKGTGTLLEVGADLTLIDSKVNAVVGVGSDVLDVTAVKLDGGNLTLAGESEVAGKITGKGGVGYIASTGNNQSFDVTGNVTLKNDNESKYGMTDKFTDVIFTTAKSDNLILDFAVADSEKVNKVTLNNAELKSIDGSSSTEKIELTVDSTENIGKITLGQNDDKFTVTNSSHKEIIDMGAGDNDEFNVSMGAVDAVHKKEAGNTFDYKVNNAEKIVLNGNGWHIGDNAELNAGTAAKEKPATELHIADKGSLHVDMNNNFGKGNVTTSLDKMAEGGKLSVTTGEGAEVKFVVGDEFNVSQKQFDVATSYDIEKANVTSAVIFKSEKVNDKDVRLTVKEASEIISTEGENKGVNLGNYKAIYDTMLGALSDNSDLREAVNYQNASNLVDMVVKTNNTAEAFYTTGYAVTKDVADTYMSVVEDFGRKAGAGEWIAYGKYVNSDTEFDGGSKSKGYDGDITGTVGMIEYGVNDTTSYGIVYGQGDTEVDIQGGGKLDGDNSYFGGYVKHRTQNGIDLTGNVGFTKSELDLDLATTAETYNMITSGKSDADALTFALKGKKDYKLTDTVKLQPSLEARYTLVNQDAVESSDANFRMDEQDVTIFEGMFGGNVIKEFDIYNGKLALSLGAEYVLTDVSKSEDARFTLYGKNIEFIGEEDIADNRVEGHIGIDYEHESGIGIDAKYEMIWTDKGDNERFTAGVSYRF